MTSKSSFCYFLSPFDWTSVIFPAYLLNEMIQTLLVYFWIQCEIPLGFWGLEFEITFQFSHCFINISMRKYFIYCLIYDFHFSYFSLNSSQMCERNVLYLLKISAIVSFYSTDYGVESLFIREKCHSMPSVFIYFVFLWKVIIILGICIFIYIYICICIQKI